MCVCGCACACVGVCGCESERGWEGICSWIVVEERLIQTDRLSFFSFINLKHCYKIKNARQHPSQETQQKHPVLMYVRENTGLWRRYRANAEWRLWKFCSLIFSQWCASNSERREKQSGANDLTAFTGTAITELVWKKLLDSRFRNKNILKPLLKRIFKFLWW